MSELMSSIAKVVGFIVVFSILIVFFSFLGAFLVMWLWNLCIPEIFGLAKITYWSAFQLSLLCNLLFKSVNTSSWK